MRRKTTVYLDEDLLRDVKVEAAHEGRAVSDILEEALRARGRAGSLDRRRVPEWAGSFSSTEVTGAASEDIVRDELGRSAR